MKRIINGKKYDTETAEKVAKWSNHLSHSDFSHMEEELYRKKTGEFFLYGQGGPMTRYAECEGNSVIGGYRIIPLSEFQAKEWVEAHANADYEDIFGAVEE